MAQNLSALDRQLMAVSRRLYLQTFLDRLVWCSSAALLLATAWLGSVADAVYCSTKGAVLALTRDLAAEWAQHNIRVNCVAPGWFRTDMNAALMKNKPFLARILDRVPLGRLGEPDDVVGPVVFLASDAGAMVTGQILPIDGGVSGIASLTREPVVD